MRTSVYTLILLEVHLFCWSFDTVAASGGALDSTPTFQTTGASSTSHSKISAFSATDGLAQVVAHKSSELSIQYVLPLILTNIVYVRMRCDISSILYTLVDFFQLRIPVMTTYLVSQRLLTID